MQIEMEKENEFPLYSKLLKVRDQLRSSGHRIALAESCSAGLVAAELGQIPGISEHFVGSMVVYRTPTKNAWLGIDNRLLLDPEIGPVSRQVTECLLHALLERTPEATFVASITGHLGPNAPESQDGVVHCGVCFRKEQIAHVRTFHLTAPPPTDTNDIAARAQRQRQAAALLIEMISDHLGQEEKTSFR
jgi:PncC family amidohydrolase